MTRERAIRWIAGALIAVHAWLLLAAAAPSTSLLHPLSPLRKGPTFDEYFYIATGVAYLRTGDFSENREHPPLAKQLAGLPVAYSPDVDFPAHWQDLLHYPIQFFYGRNGGHLARNLFLARLPFIFLALVADLALFRVAFSMAGAVPALAALGLAVFDPSWLAAASTANLDFPIAAFSFLAMVGLRRALMRATAGSILVAAVLLGAAMLTKFTALLLLPAALCMTAAAAFAARSWKRPAAILALTLLGAVSVFAAGYGFESRSLESVRAHPKFVAKSGAVLEHPALRGAVLAAFGTTRGVPLLTAIKGVDHMLSETGRRGHRGYLLGQTSPETIVLDPVAREEKRFYRGWPSFYAAVLAQKLPLATTILLLAGLVVVIYAKRPPALDLAFLLATPAVVVLAFSFSNAQLGVKYVLPAMPFLFLIAGRAASGRLAPAIAAGGVGLAAAGSLTCFPDSAMFSSVLAGGNDLGHRVAVIGDDWGQDAPGLAIWARDLDELGRAYESERWTEGPATAAALAAFARAHGGEAEGPTGVGGADGKDATLAAARAIRERGLAYRYYGEGNAAAYGFDFEPLPPGPRKGLLAVHATNLHRESSEFGWLEHFDRNALDGDRMPGIFGAFLPGRWIVSHEPVAKIGRAIFVYFIR